MAYASIPTVDLRALAAPADSTDFRGFVATLGEALTSSGFLIVEGHGIPPEDVQQAYEHFKSFFALPVETKMKYSGVEGGARGYTPYGVEHAKDSQSPDRKEFWQAGQHFEPGHRFSDRFPPNPWPTEIPGFGASAATLFVRLEAISRKLLAALELHFKLPDGTFSNMVIDGNSILRILHYPPSEAPPAPGTFRAAPHEDINLITLLCEATDSGLEILTREGEWMGVQAGPGQIVADAGDMLARLTNDVVPATTHRVVETPGGSKTSRYSIPFFAHPYPDCDLTVMEHFTSAENPPKYEPITADEYLEERLREIGLKK